MSDPLMPQLNTLACAWARENHRLRCLAALDQMTTYWQPEMRK